MAKRIGAIWINEENDTIGISINFLGKQYRYIAFKNKNKEEDNDSQPDYIIYTRKSNKKQKYYRRKKYYRKYKK